jgi:membrane protease YdiL (CAAX protease family)
MRHALVAALFVGLWMALGWLLSLDAEAYLLLGVPLTIAFQLFVRREPLRALWVRAAPAWRRRAGWAVIAIALGALPVYELAARGAAQAGPVAALSYLAAIAGAGAAAYALLNLDRRALRALVPAVIAVVLAGGFQVGVGVIRHGTGLLEALSLVQIARWSLLYFAVGFVLEEVTFRGALDTLVQASSLPGWLSAAWVALLWGLWHLPTVPLQHNVVATIVAIAAYQLVVGVLLAYAWRIGGNLAIPAAAHALIDGMRNAVLLAGT